MTIAPEKLNGRERRAQIDRIVADCREKARKIVVGWQLTNPDWKVIEGCAYLRLSTDEQVAVEKGSLEQQINIAVSEATIRSSSERINYRITHFYIEPGITGTTDRRPEFQSLLKQIKAQRHKFVIMKELARITREVSVWKDFFNLCNSNQCSIIIRGFPFNPNDPGQIFQLDILAAFAAYESNQTSKRVRESVHSAMISSGKFNSTPRVLGLKQQSLNGEPQVGFYEPNFEELKTVIWIMQTFLKYGSYTRTLEECARHGIKNLKGGPFKTHALINLLTNKRYIGKWEVNLENRHKETNLLMPYDRYAEIELNYGCLVDTNLWQQVQAMIAKIKGSKDKNTKLNRIYPLSGLLKALDGSSFAGGSAWKGKHRHTYYYNSTHQIRLSAELIEEHAIAMVGEILRGSPKMQRSIEEYGSDVQTASELCLKQCREFELEIAALLEQKTRLNQRLDWFLSTASGGESETFRTEYKAELAKINADLAKAEFRRADLLKKASALKSEEFNWKAIGQRCEAILKFIQEKDAVALKNAYRQLFEAIIVGEIGSDGQTELKFVLNGEDDGGFPDSVNRRKKVRVDDEMAREEGFEPPTNRLTADCSTTELLPNKGLRNRQITRDGQTVSRIKGPEVGDSRAKSNR